MFGKLSFLVVGFSMVVSSAALGATDNFVYTDDNVAGPNTVSAYRVASDGALSPVAGSPFLTNGTGNGGGLDASTRVRARHAGQWLFVTNAGSGNISVFSVDANSGVLTLTGSQPACGSGAGDMSIALSGNKWVLCAAASSKTLTVYEFNTGTGALAQARPPVSLGATPGAMEVSPDGKLVAVALVNTDRVAVYSINTGSGALSAAAGSPFASPGGGAASGLDWNSGSSRLFVGELAATGVRVNVFDVSTAGVLSAVGSHTMSSPANSAVVQLSLDDRFLYVTNSGSSTVTAFSVATSGSLSPIGVFGVGPGQPAGMALRDDGRLLYVASYPYYVAVMSIHSSGALLPAPGSPTYTGRPAGLESLASYPPPGAAAPDLTAPTTTLSQSPSLEWCVSDVTVTLSATDNAGGSGVKSITYSVDGATPVTVNGGSASFAITTEGVHTISYFAIDNASNAETLKLATVRIDRTAPTIETSAAPGWYSGDVVVSWTCSDALSGIEFCSSPTTLSSEGAGQSVNGKAEDNAGNTTFASVSGIGIDRTPPTIVGSQTPPAGAGGWNNGDVMVSWACSDALSGVASCSTPTVFGAEGAGQSASGTASDNAGNTAAALYSPVKIDKTAPTITAGSSPPPNGWGWNNGPVTTTFSCSDALSGVASCSSPAVLSTEGAAQESVGTAVDVAENTANASSGPINIDLTPPTINGQRTPAANGAGWNNTDVTVSWDCADALSGVDACSPSSLVSSEGQDQSRAGDASDKAGNTASATLAGISLDKTAPTITADRTPAANGAGWNNSAVTTSFTCSDALSGIASCSEAIVRAGEGAGQDALGTATDRADNTAQASGGVINIDLTAPSIQGQRSPAANGFGWNNGPVTVSFDCSDALSGVASCSSPSIVSGEGSGQSVSGQASDQAGNQNSAEVSGINLDLTAPQILASRLPVANGFGWNNGPVTVSFECSDALSGIASCSSPVTLSAEGAGLGASGNAQDKAGNGAAAALGDVNIDLTPPTISVPSALTVEATGPTGATVAYASSASDALSGMVDFTCSPASGAVFPLGTTTVACSALDRAGNPQTASFTVKVQDTTPPVVTPPADVSQFATSALGATVGYPAASAQDLVDGALSASCSPASGSFFSLGATTVTCSATDAAGNTGSATFKVLVTFQTSAPFFLQPVNADGSSVFKLGSTVPVKFQLAGVSAGITNLTARILIAKVSNGVAGTELEATSTSAATSGNLFRYSADGALYIFNLGTKPLSAGTWQIRADLGDGILRVVNISLKN